jgi:hypothetical protein
MQHQPEGPLSTAGNSSGSARSNSSVGSLEEQILIMKREIDSLQIESAQKKTPWFKQIPVLVSIGALLLAGLTTYYSERRSDEQELHNARTELRQVLFEIDAETRRLALVPADANAQRANAQVDSATDPANAANVTMIARSEAVTRRIILTNQAAELVEELGDSVTATEYYALGVALSQLGTYDDRIFEYYRRGLEKPADSSTRLALLRGLAGAYFGTDRAEEGRPYYSDALSVPFQFSTTKLDNDAYTHYLWAVNELYVGNCGEATEQLTASHAGYEDLQNAGGTVLPAITTQLQTVAESIKERC